MKTSFAAAVVALAAASSSLSAQSPSPPSPYGAGAPQSPAPSTSLAPMQEPAQPGAGKEARDVQASPSVDATTDKDAIIRALQKQLDELKAGMPSSTPKEASKPDEATYRPGFVIKILKAETTPASFGTPAATKFSEDPLAAYSVKDATFNYASFAKSTKISKDERVAYRAQAFLRVKEPGRHAFRTIIKLADRIPKGTTGWVTCATEVLLNGQTILEGSDGVGPTGKGSMTAIAGVDLAPGLYRIEWGTFCPISGPYAAYYETSLEVKTPSDDGPVAPKSDMILVKIENNKTK